MPRTIDEIRRDACYNSEAQARTKPLLTGEKCCCTSEEGCFKFRSSNLSQTNQQSPGIRKKNVWPKCADCGECHPSPTDELLNKDIIERARKAEKKVDQLPAKSKGMCQWPNPCPADCFENHGRNEKWKVDPKDDTCAEKVCGNLKKTSYSAFPGI